jgi:phosphinothricin acetyltransferase
VIRRGCAEDLAALTDIYNHYVRETAITFDLEPHTLEKRRPWLEGFAATGRHQLFVAERAGQVVGYACSRGFRDKRAYDSSAETSVYLAPDAQRGGFGTALYTRLFEAIASEDVHRFIAGITLPNDASIALHAKFGFERVGVMREVGRKFGRYWDVLWMEKSGSSASVPGGTATEP